MSGSPAPHRSRLLEVLARLAGASRAGIGPIARAAGKNPTPVSNFFAGTGAGKIAAWEWVVYALGGEVELIPRKGSPGSKALRVRLAPPSAAILAQAATVIERAYLAAGRGQNSIPSIDKARERAFGKALAASRLRQWHQASSLEHAAGLLLQMKGLRLYEAAIATGASQRQLANYVSWVDPGVKRPNVPVPALDICLRVAAALGYQIRITLAPRAGLMVAVPGDAGFAARRPAR